MLTQEPDIWDFHGTLSVNNGKLIRYFMNMNNGELI